MDLNEAKQKMLKTLEHVKLDVATIRTGRANPALVENLVINAYGGTAKMRVMEVAGITVPEPQVIELTPYDQSIIGDIRRDIEAANVGLQPVIDNNVIRIAFPPLTAERRLEYVKMLHVKLEDGRVKLRQIRHGLMGEVKELPEDECKRLEKELQDLTDKMMIEVEYIGKKKEQDLVTV